MDNKIVKWTLSLWKFSPPTDVLSHGCYVSGCFVPMYLRFTAGRFVRPNVSARRMFCPSGRFVPGLYVYLRYCTAEFFGTFS
jgi:hypothetical protein